MLHSLFLIWISFTFQLSFYIWIAFLLLPCLVIRLLLLLFASLFWSRTFFSTKGTWGVRKSLKLLVSFKKIEVNANRYNNHACKCKKEYLFKDDVNCHLHLHSPLKINSHFICVTYFRVNQDIQSGVDSVYKELIESFFSYLNFLHRYQRFIDAGFGQLCLLPTIPACRREDPRRTVSA